MTNFFNYEVTPPLAYIVGICMFLNALLISAKGWMQSHPEMGYSQRSNIVTVAMYVVSAWLMIRCLTIFQTKSININVIFLAIAFLFWRLNDMRDYVKRSKKRYDKEVAIERSFADALEKSPPVHHFGVTG